MKQTSVSAKQTAAQILELTRRRLAQEIPALMLPLYLFRDQPIEKPIPPSTDGAALFYCPQQLIADFKADRNLPARLQRRPECLHASLPPQPPCQGTGPVGRGLPYHGAVPENPGNFLEPLGSKREVIPVQHRPGAVAQTLLPPLQHLLPTPLPFRLGVQHSTKGFVEHDLLPAPQRLPNGAEQIGGVRL